MAKRINIIYLGSRNEENKYILCEHKSYDPSDKDTKFKDLTSLLKFLNNGFLHRKRLLEVALDKEIPPEDKEKLVNFIKGNFPRAKIIDYQLF
ncbi:MAG: hypothetical protein QXP53_00785 [Candidatus Pacearchaeota archaeon]